jgi:nicotinamide phosphoribosyltransferase
MSVLNKIRETYGVAGDTDSYKFSHPAQYEAGVDRLMSHIFSRGSDKFDKVQFFGLQLLIKEYLQTKLTHEQVDNLIAFQKSHLFGVEIPKLEIALRAVVDDYDGYMPLRIRAIPEGTVLPVKQLLATVESAVADERIIALTTYMETMIMRLWAPTTVATTSYHIKEIIYNGLLKSADDADAEIGFKLHDFGSRGVSSFESAAFNGAAHLVNFLGSDTTVGIMAANIGYHEEMSGFSIPATEHSTTTSFGAEGEEAFLEQVFDNFAKEGAIFATVADSYDIMNFVENITPKFKDRLRASGATWVIRPDSGDPVETPIELVRRLARIFGFTYNGKGYKVLDSVRVIQGDGIDIEDVRAIVDGLLAENFSISNIAFGMGGGLLQKNNRDTLKFAMKACAKHKNGVWEDVYKDPTIYDATTWEPIHSSFKKSMAGRLELMFKVQTGEYKTVRVEEVAEYEAKGYKAMLEDVYDSGVLLRDMTLAEVRENAKLPEEKARADRLEIAEAIVAMSEDS